MRVRIVEVGENGTFLLPLPSSILDVMKWNEGDILNLEVIMSRNGSASHIVLERKASVLDEFMEEDKV